MHCLFYVYINLDLQYKYLSIIVIEDHVLIANCNNIMLYNVASNRHVRGQNVPFGT